jgi:hypothetical protein
MAQNRYMDLLNIKDEASALIQIKELASDLTDHEHLIRSCIFDLHAAVEIELRRIFFWHFQFLLFFTDDEKLNKKIKSNFEKMIDRSRFMDMWRILRPVMIDWYPDFDSIDKINETRNQAAHSDVKKVRYKGRNPFDNPDCLCQIYFDVWAIKRNIPKFFEHIVRPYYLNRAYYEKYGDIGISREVRDEVDSWYKKQ